MFLAQGFSTGVEYVGAAGLAAKRVTTVEVGNLRAICMVTFDAITQRILLLTQVVVDKVGVCN